MKRPENIALFDIDGALCDYERGLFDGLERLRSPQEDIYKPPIRIMLLYI